MERLVIWVNATLSQCGRIVVSMCMFSFLQCRANLWVNPNAIDLSGSAPHGKSISLVLHFHRCTWRVSLFRRNSEIVLDFLPFWYWKKWWLIRVLFLALGESHFTLVIPRCLVFQTFQTIHVCLLFNDGTDPMAPFPFSCVLDDSNSLVFLIIHHPWYCRSGNIHTHIPWSHGLGKIIF